MENLFADERIWTDPLLAKFCETAEAFSSKLRVDQRTLLKVLLNAAQQREPPFTKDEIFKVIGKPPGPIERGTGGRSSPVFTAVTPVRQFLKAFGKEFNLEIDIPHSRYSIFCSSPPPDVWKLKVGRPIGLLIANAADWFTGNIVLGAIRACRKAGAEFNLIVDVSNDEPEEEEDRLEALLDKTEGVLMVPVGDRPLSQRGLDLIGQKHCVMVDRYFLGIRDIPSVHHDDISGGRRAADYLIATRGCRRIVILGQHSALRRKQELSPLQDREWGCSRQAKGKAEIIDPHPIGADELAGFDGLKAIDKQIKLKGTDGIFALTDRVALGCRHYLEQKGARWLNHPLIGFEGQAFGGFLNPPLPSIKADSVEMGFRAASILIKKIQRKQVPSPDAANHYLVTPTILLPSGKGRRLRESKISYSNAADLYLKRS